MDARAARPLARCFGEGARVVADYDALVHPELSRTLYLLACARSPVDRARARGARQLHGGSPYARAYGVHEHAFARLKTRLRKERVVRSDEDLGHGRRLREVERVWNLGEMTLGHDDVL